jgi:hypothetical protein
MRATHLLIAATAAIAASSASAQITVGNAGFGTPNGVITAPPAGGATYRYVSTFNGVGGAGQIAGVGGTNGSSYTTDAFAAAAGSELTFYFNFVTSDGTGSFPDYAWSALLPSVGAPNYIFTARTTTSGNTVPGFGLPGLASILTPSATPIIPGGPVWDKLGGSSGACFGGPGNGCGYTGWIKSTYTIADAGTYRLQFGVSNFGDTSLDTGLAFTGALVDGNPVDPVPEPATWAMLIAGFGLVGAAARRRRNAAVAA